MVWPFAELAAYFDGKPTKILVTTSNRPITDTYKFAETLVDILPNAEFFHRKVGARGSRTPAVILHPN